MDSSWRLHSEFTHLLWYPKGTELQLQRSKCQLKEGGDDGGGEWVSGFQMPLHYPRYSEADYEKMEECKVDMLLREYGLCFKGTLEEKRAYAMGAFLWPDQV